MGILYSNPHGGHDPLDRDEHAQGAPSSSYKNSNSLHTNGKNDNNNNNNVKRIPSKLKKQFPTPNHGSNCLYQKQNIHQQHRSLPPMHDPAPPESHSRDMDAAKILVGAQDLVISQRLTTGRAAAAAAVTAAVTATGDGDAALAMLTGTATDTQITENTVLDLHSTTRSGKLNNSALDSVAAYEHQRSQIRRREAVLAFDHRLTAAAGLKEHRANAVIQRLKQKDQAEIYDPAPPTQGHGGQLHPRFAGDHFLTNAGGLIERTDLFKVARMMPKGAHLHIHFNACLDPHVLLEIATGMSRMFVRSSVPLVDGVPFAFESSEIQFSIRGPGAENPGDLFDRGYMPGQEMQLRVFLDRFPRAERGDPMTWLEEKLRFGDEEAHNTHQTVLGVWDKFNGRTRMMKGLFNYETAYRTYTRKLLEDLAADNIQYAEIRPNFMTSNQLWSDDGTRQIDNRGIMDIITGEYERFNAEKKGGYFAGLKIIYCTPRSFSNEQVRAALEECLEFKKEEKWARWIAGFDLVGEEGKIHPLKQFIPEFLWFRSQCAAEGLDIPFLFHCGETLEMGTDTDGNLLDALLLGSRRIGHGFALARHPYVMEHMKKHGVCLEVCPISNEVLGLTPRIGGHAMYNLLANNVHCTVSSDNGTLFGSTLSHDFYQVMVGKADMTLHGWRQLIEWSLEHACMEEDMYEEVKGEWLKLWDAFLDNVLHEFGHLVPGPAEAAPASGDASSGGGVK